MNGNGGREEEGTRGDTDNIFLPAIKENENSDSSPSGLTVTRSRQRPLSLSPRVEHVGSLDSTSSSGDEYEEGLIGTTPPYAQRLTKTRRRSNKFKRITTSPYPEFRDKQKVFSKTRPQSADWILLDPPIITPDENIPRRHTISDIVPNKKTYGFNNYASFGDGKTIKVDKESSGEKRKKKEKERKQDRDEKKRHHQQQSAPSFDNVPQLTILSPMADISTSFADKVNIHSSPTPIKQHPLLVSSLTSHELHTSRKLLEEGEGGWAHLTRSNSDVQLSMSLSSSQSIRCPSDRNKFYKNFRKALTVLSKRQHIQQSTGIHQSGFHVPRQHSENYGLENPFGHVVDQTWQELRAWQADRTLEEQEDWDFEHHREVDVVLNRIIQYRFDSQTEELNIRLFAGTERERDEYEPLTSLTSTTRLDKGDGYNYSEETTPLSSLNTGGADGQGQKEENCDEDDDQGPRTLTQQGSMDSDESSSSSKSSDEYSIEKFLSPEQLSALSEVNQLLDELENVEGLYSNSKKLGDENPKYRQPSFRRKRDALILWVKVTKGLADHLSRLSKWFGMQIVSTLPSIIHTPCTPSRTTSDSTSHGSHPLSFSDLSITDPEVSLGGFSRLSSSVFLSQSSQVSSVSSKGRHFSPRNISAVDSSPSLWKGYRKFVDRTLKKKGLKWMIDELLKFIAPIFYIAEEAVKIRVEQFTEEEGFTDDDVIVDPPRESWPLLPFINLRRHENIAPLVTRVTSTSPRCWLDQFFEMNLPSFAQLYIQLARVTLDVMQESMRQKTEVTKNIKPSPYSIRKLIQECHMTISKGVEVRSFYRQKANLLISNNPGRLELVDADMASYEKDLKDMLQLYFSYVQQLVDVIGTYRELLEEEWTAAKEICVDITNGEIEAGLNFSHLASELVEKLQEDLKTQIDRCCDELHENSLQETEDQKQPFIESCRAFKGVIQNARESAMKSLGFAKSLMKDLEIAANFSIRGTSNDLLQVLRSSDHTQVTIPQQKGCMLFVPHQISDKQHEIQELLHVSFGRSDISSDDDNNPHSKSTSPTRHGYGSPPVCYLLVVRFSPTVSIPVWSGNTIDLVPSAENIVSICGMQVEGIKMIVRDSQQLEECRNSFFSSVGNIVEIANDKTSSHQSVAERISDLKIVICRFGHTLIDVVDRVNSNLTFEEISEREDVLDPYRSTMHTCYNLAFEYIKEVTRLLGEEFVHQRMGVELLNFAQHWMIFVITKCARGYGKIPRWSGQGLEFLLLSCSPRVLATISHQRYESLKKQMDKCLEHLVGDDTTGRGSNVGELSRIFSPVAGVPNRPNTWQRPQGRRRSNHRALSLQNLTNQNSPYVQRKLNHDDIIERIDGMSPPPSNDSINSSGIDSPTHYGCGTPLELPNISNRVTTAPSIERIDSSLFQYYNAPDFASTPAGPITDWASKLDKKKQHIQENCRQLDLDRETFLRANGIIGQERKAGAYAPLELAKLTSIRQSHFNWRRGRKLGEGQFGKVYECVNLDKGEVNAVKMISLLDKTHNKVRDILSEIQVFLKINHPNIVHLFGVEIHQTELYIFMEYCNQGTLWSAVREGLTERMIRLYTRDILRAVDALHEKRIVHRDIKSANIFLSDDSIKLGDFGLSIQLRNLNKTAPQEIRDQRGTIPYMAPEVVLKQDMGPPMDIWSVACVVVEMFTSKHPWFECDDNQFQIMFQLGQGKAPAYPKTMSEELREFLDLCFVSEPANRADTTLLLAHAFVQVTDEEPED